MNKTDLLLKKLSKGRDLFSFDYYSYDTHSSIEKDTIGLYSWHVIPPSGENESVINYHNLFGNKEYLANIRSDFGEVYEGNISYEGNKNIKDKISQTAFNQTFEQQVAFRVCSLILSPPIYIGRSDDLKTRIDDHFEELNVLLGMQEELEDVESDFEENSKDESKNFARRIKKYLLQSHDQNFEISHFYVKVISVKDLESINYEDVEKLEYFLNRTFKPIIGKL